MKVNYHKIIKNAIADGVDNGWYYSHQYTNSPSKENIKQAIIDHIVSELEEWFVFEENENV